MHFSTAFQLSCPKIRVSSSIFVPSIQRLSNRTFLQSKRGRWRLTLNPTEQDQETRSSSEGTQDSIDDEFSKLKKVTIELPLELFLDELPDGRVFIDEMVSSGNAAQSGLLRIGDIINAISVPFGDSMVPVPKEDALDRVSSFIQTREGDTISMLIDSSRSIEDLRSIINVDEDDGEGVLRSRELAPAIHVDEYPFVQVDDDEEDMSWEERRQALLDYGFSLDEIEEPS